MSSLLPLLLNLQSPGRLHDQHYALALTPNDILAVIEQPSQYRPWKQLSSILQDASSSIKTDKNKFQINLDVQHFTPEEITVKTCDGFVVIDGRHEEKRDEHGWVSRQFTDLPDSCSAEAVQSRLSSDGVLTITAPFYPTQASNERLVPIVHTGPVRSQPEGSKFQSGDGIAGGVLLENSQA